MTFSRQKIRFHQHTFNNKIQESELFEIESLGIGRHSLDGKFDFFQQNGDDHTFVFYTLKCTELLILIGYKSTRFLRGIYPLVTFFILSLKLIGEVYLQLFKETFWLILQKTMIGSLKILYRFNKMGLLHYVQPDYQNLIAAFLGEWMNRKSVIV